MKNTHGGKREGAGRKPGTDGAKGKILSCRVTPELHAKVSELASEAGLNISEFINQMIQRESRKA